MDTIKKRGRKPKPKPDVESVPKKKRGRKKKCELNLETYKKITGFNENGESIDTKENKIQFMDEEVPLEDNLENQENFSFGGIFNIQKIQSSQKEETQELDLKKIFHNKTKEKTCDIDISDIDEEDSTEETNKTKKNLCDFFGELKENKVEKTKKTNIYAESYDKNNHQKFKQTENIKILHCYKGKEKELPKKTDILCWWCCHPFDTIPRFIPTKHDTIRRRYKVTGTFCGWSCAKAFAFYDTNYTIKNNMMMLTSLIREIHGYYHDVKCAPPRTILKAFGGTMSIEEFRSIDKNVYYEINNHVMSLDSSMMIRKLRIK